MPRSNQIFHKIQHPFADRRCFGGTWTLIKSVQDNEERELSWQFEHVLETFCEGGITWLLGAIIACGVQFIEDILATVRAASELE
jgi:hypothetical protein